MAFVTRAGRTSWQTHINDRALLVGHETLIAIEKSLAWAGLCLHISASPWSYVFVQCVYVDVLENMGTVHLFMKLDINVPFFCLHLINFKVLYIPLKKGHDKKLSRKKRGEGEKKYYEWFGWMFYIWCTCNWGPFCNCEINWISANRFRSCAIQISQSPIQQSNNQRRRERERKKLTHP